MEGRGGHHPREPRWYTIEGCNAAVQSKGLQKRLLRPLLEDVYALIPIGPRLRTDPGHFDVLLTVTGLR